MLVGREAGAWFIRASCVPPCVVCQNEHAFENFHRQRCTNNNNNNNNFFTPLSHPFPPFPSIHRYFPSLKNDPEALRKAQGDAWTGKKIGEGFLGYDATKVRGTSREEGRELLSSKGMLFF